MSDQILRLIDKTLDELPPELLSHIGDEDKEFLCKDRKALRRWIKVPLRFVLEALGEDKKAAGVLAERLPKPWLWHSYGVDLSQVPPDEREEYDRLCREQIQRQHDRYKEELDGLRAEQKELEEQRTATYPESVRQIKDKLAAVCESLAACEKWLEDCRRRLESKEVPAPLVRAICADWYPPAVRRACDEAREKDAKALEKWDTAFFEKPSVWLWALWGSWKKVTKLPAIPGLPDWPSLDRLPQQDRQGFLFNITWSLRWKIKASPGEATNDLRRGLEDLRDRLEKTRKKRRQRKRTHKVKEQAGRETADLTAHAASDTGQAAVAGSSDAAAGRVDKPSGFLGAMDLAKRFNVPEEKMDVLHKRLERFRKKHGDDPDYVISVEGPRPRDSRYLHSIEHIRPLIEDLARPV